MSAYHSTVIQIRKTGNYDSMLRDFTDVLLANGFVYDCPDDPCGNNTLEDVIAWNTEKLRADFVLGWDEHFSHDFRQIRWKYRGFSEVRQFILNETEESSRYFEIVIIIPERDFITYDQTGHPLFDPQAVAVLEQLALRIWELDFVETIQTELELTECAVPPGEIERGLIPAAFPFAVIPAACLGEYRHNPAYVCEPAARDGILFARKHC